MLSQNLNKEQTAQLIQQQARTALQQRPLDWEKCNQLIPAMIQHATSGQLLMQGYMTPEALEQTITGSLVTFWSRSKQRLWTKGESSGHTLALSSLHIDCDGDAILIKALPNGPTCHTGTTSCFNDDNQPATFSFLYQLESYLKERRHADPNSSYTASLFAEGTKRMAQKVGEEGVEVALAATVNDQEELLNESADLLYHLTLLLEDQHLSLEQVIQVLQRRHNKT